MNTEHKKHKNQFSKHSPSLSSHVTAPSPSLGSLGSCTSIHPGNKFVKHRLLSISTKQFPLTIILLQLCLIVFLWLLLGLLFQLPLLLQPNCSPLVVLIHQSLRILEIALPLTLRHVDEKIVEPTCHTEDLASILHPDAKPIQQVREPQLEGANALLHSDSCRAGYLVKASSPALHIGIQVLLSLVDRHTVGQRRVGRVCQDHLQGNKKKTSDPETILFFITYLLLHTYVDTSSVLQLALRPQKYSSAAQ